MLKRIIRNKYFTLLRNYFYYLIRWQLSTPVLSWCWAVLTFSVLVNTIIANLIGGLIFFWIDLFLIFRGKSEDFLSGASTIWESKENVDCFDCGDNTLGFRVVKGKDYDRTKDKNPQYRCPVCCMKKYQKLLQEGKVS